MEKLGAEKEVHTDDRFQDSNGTAEVELDMLCVGNIILVFH